MACPISYISDRLFFGLSYMHLAIGKKLGADVRYFALEFLAAIHLALSYFEAD
jgi:hypothetical protein